MADSSLEMSREQVLLAAQFYLKDKDMGREYYQ
jgi:hypothetical protein